MIPNPAFEHLRKFKPVSADTEELCMRKFRGLKNSDLLEAFENGISGRYGKVYSLDPQTIIGWVDQHKKKNTVYLDKGLLDPNKNYFELGVDDWIKEANKCYIAYLNGTGEACFHPGVYDRMMLDRKIEINACAKYLNDDFSNVTEAKQKVLRDKFGWMRSHGWNDVYR